MKIEERFRNNLVCLRRELDLTQKEAGDVCGFTAANISHFETGNRAPSLKNLEKLRIGLSSTYEELLS